MTIYEQQCLLGFLGYLPPLSQDGVYGQQTQNAIKSFQRDYGLTPDGDAGTATQKMLRGVVAGTVARKGPPANNVAQEAQRATTGTFWDRVKYFRREEFRCPCGKCSGFPVEPQEAIVMEADAMREHLGVPVTIIPLSGDPHAGGSGVRCKEYNATFPNSVSNSRHLEGKAVDFSTSAPTDKVESWLNTRRNAGKLRYWYRISDSSWHMDVE